jgi:hypothetical protein
MDSKQQQHPDFSLSKPKITKRNWTSRKKTKATQKKKKTTSKMMMGSEK